VNVFSGGIETQTWRFMTASLPDGRYEGKETLQADGMYLSLVHRWARSHRKLSSKSGQFLRRSAPVGYDALVADPHEIAQCARSWTDQYFLECARNLPLISFSSAELRSCSPLRPPRHPEGVDLHSLLPDKKPARTGEMMTFG